MMWMMMEAHTEAHLDGSYRTQAVGDRSPFCFVDERNEMQRCRNDSTSGTLHGDVATRLACRSREAERASGISILGPLTHSLLNLAHHHHQRCTVQHVSQSACLH